MAIELAAGTYLAYPTLGLVRPYRMRWTFTNTSDKAWTSLVILTGPSSFLGTLNDALGGTGNPPDIVDFSIITPRQVSGGGGDGVERIRDAFQPVENGQQVKIRLDFDGPFGQEQYIQFTFYYTDEDGISVPVNGTLTSGQPRPVPRTSPLLENAGKGASLIFKSEAAPELGLRVLQDEVRRLRSRVASPQVILVPQDGKDLRVG